MKKCFLFVILSFIFSITYAQENSINCEVARQKYLQQNPDVSNAGFDPWDHYNRHGKKEGRIWPSCDNEINCEVAHQKYLEQNPDVANAGMDPWVHYNRHGKKEGRIWPSCDNERKASVENNKTNSQISANDNTKSQTVEYMYCSSGNCDDGFGTMLFPSNTGFKEYTGTWRKKVMNEFGRYVDCYFLNCRFVKGKLIFTDGGYYEGTFDSDGRGLYQGYGYLKNSNGTYKKGDFFKGALNGDGEESSTDGVIYRGQFLNGVRQGKGILTYPNGDIVKGRYWQGKFISEKDDVSNAKLDITINGLNPSNKTTYSTALINGKEWMTQNLDLTTFRNGDIIPQAKTEQDLIDANKNQFPIWCYFDFNPATETHYGKLYNWFALNDPRGLMPLGFVTPSVQDWQSINNFSYFKNLTGRSQLYISSTKEIRGGKINTKYSFSFENGPFKEKKYDRAFGVPEDDIGYYWTSGNFQDRYNDRINVYYINSNGRVGIDEYEHKGACVSVRGIKGDHNYYSGNWIGNIKSGNGTEFYGINTEIKGFGIVHKGDKYTGNWVNGVQDGEGSIILNNGEIKTGLWKNGEFKGEWKYVDNRHKCYQCNTNVCKSIKRTSSEIETYKKNAYSNEVGIYNTQSYCSSTCEAKAIAIQKAREKQYERESQNNLTKQQTSNKSNSLVNNCSTGSNEYVFICDDCGKMLIQNSEPYDKSTCPETRWGGIGQAQNIWDDGDHNYAKIGTSGACKYSCNRCHISINLDRDPISDKGTCGASGSNCCSHYWIKNN